MDRMPLPPETFFAGTPPHVRAYIEQLHTTIADLHTRIAELQSKQAKNSTNSSLPPSSEHPHAKPVRPTPKSPRGCGGQPGHAKHERPLLPTQQCQQVIPCVPPTCRRCAAPLAGTDPQPLRHQIWELPEIKPCVTEYQRHRLTCRCGTVTCGALPAGVPTGQAGPRLIAFSGLLMSCFRQSKRRAALFLSMIRVHSRNMAVFKGLAR
jgi:transposase